MGWTEFLLLMRCYEGDVTTLPVTTCEHLSVDKYFRLFIRKVQNNMFHNFVDEFWKEDNFTLEFHR